MPLQCPLQQGFEDGVIDTLKIRLRIMIHRPTAHDPAEFCDQLPRRGSLRSSNNLPDSFQERVDVLARRLDQGPSLIPVKYRRPSAGSCSFAMCVIEPIDGKSVGSVARSSRFKVTHYPGDGSMWESYVRRTAP
jgi:hypothetical protein